MPLVIQIVERIDDADPGIVAIAIHLAKRPAFATPAEASQFTKKPLPMSVMAAQARVTHLVYEHLPLDTAGQPALNKDLVPRRLVQTIAPVQAHQIRSAPHRARSDAAVEQFAVQVVKEPF